MTIISQLFAFSHQSILLAVLLLYLVTFLFLFAKYSPIFNLALSSIIGIVEPSL
jgi:hypothetical protein